MRHNKGAFAEGAEDGKGGVEDEGRLSGTPDKDVGIGQANGTLSPEIAAPHAYHCEESKPK